MLNGRSAYDSTRDPRLNSLRDSGNDTGIVLAKSSNMEANKSDTHVKNEPNAACEIMSDAPNPQHEGFQAVKQEIIELLTCIAGHTEENAELQRGKAALAFKLRNESDRVRIMAASHATAIASHKKRVDEKDELIAENAKFQDKNAELRGQIASYWKTRSNNEAKIFQLEQENEMILGKVASLESENRMLKETVATSEVQAQEDTQALRDEIERLRRREKQLQLERDLMQERIKSSNGLEERPQAVAAEGPSLERSRDGTQHRDRMQAAPPRHFENSNSGSRKHAREESFSDDRARRHNRQDFRRNFRPDGYPQNVSWAPSGPRGDRRR